MKIEKINDNSNTTSNSNQIDILKKNFPNCFDKNGKFIPSKMSEIFNQNDISKESYSLNWLGKSYARLLANENPLTLIKEDKTHNSLEENINSQNLLIKGDNLEVLKHLKNAYSESIKMIYIDPPYNTGSDGFVYNDKRKFSIGELSQLAGVSLDEAKDILDFTNSKSNSHSAWLTFMYPRLYIARELLKDDGVIFISIDDNEVAQLRLLCDEVFGEDNFITEIIWQGMDTIKNDAKYFSDNHEYILSYAKNKSSVKVKGQKRTEEHNKVYKNPDNDNRGPYLLTPLHAKSGTEDGIYSYTFKNGKVWKPPVGTYPRFSQNRLEELENDNRIYFGKKDDATPQRKTFLSEVPQYVKLTTFWDYKFNTFAKTIKQLSY